MPALAHNLDRSKRGDDAPQPDSRVATTRPEDARRGSALAPYLFVLPALVVYAVFVLVPIADSFHLSLFRWPSAAGQPRLVFLANFADLLRDRVFWSALLHNLVLLLLSLATQLPLAMLLAVLLNDPIRGRGVLRTALFAPMIMPSVAIAVLWLFIYAPEQGMLDRLLGVFQPGFAYGWLSEGKTALLCVFITICWRYTGFHMVLFMAGLATIPEQLYEAARLDGASEWQICRRIVLPMLRPMIRISATLSIIGSLKYFDLVYMMAAGAPERSRELMATYIYRLAFASGQGRYGYGSAAAVLLFVLALAVVVCLTSFTDRNTT